MTLVLRLFLASALAVAGHASLAQEPAKVMPLLQRALDIDGKELVMLRVDFPPGGADQVHRHDADVFVYMLSGSVVMQVRGGPEVTLNPGDTFAEEKDDVHVVGRIASDSEPASFLAIFVKDADKPPVLPAQ